MQGNLDIQGGSSSLFHGVMYVDGDLTVRGPALLKGIFIIVTGDVDIQGHLGEYAEIEHDPDVINNLLNHMGQYRLTKAPFTPSNALPDGRPTEGVSPGLGGP